MRREDTLAIDAIRRWREHPAQMVRELFRVEPDAWQVAVLDAFPHRQRQALKACKGPGKTTVLAWLCWNFLLTRPHPKIAATSITDDNLKDGLWTEMAKWMGVAPLLQHAFTWRRERIESKEHPSTWWMSARNWPKSGDPNQQADTLAGLHADYLLFVIDEAGGIPPAVMVAADAGLSTGIESHLLIAGNPTSLEGALHQACALQRGLWDVTEISSAPDDPDRTPRVSKEWAQQQIDTYGADNPWVLVNVFGRFPPGSLNALVSVDDANAALGRHLSEDAYGHASIVLGVDVALMGDDRTVIFPRQGLAGFAPTVLRVTDSMQIAGHVAQAIASNDADGTFIDATGGWGQGVISALRALNHAPIEVMFSGKAGDPQFHNKRAEMWWGMAAWIKQGGCLPRVPEIVAELTQTTYAFRGDRILIEPKEQLKAKIGRSPDMADALACTFAFPLPPRRQARLMDRYKPKPYDVFADVS